MLHFFRWMLKMKNKIFKEYSDKVMCLVCKIYISNHSQCLETHVNGKKHQLLICNSIRVRDDEIYCRLCNIIINDTSIICLGTLQSHLKQYCHMTALKKIKDVVDDFITMPEDSDCYDILCTICECNIPFKLDDIFKHCNGHRHKNKRSIAAQPLNGIIDVKDDDDQLWCKVCKSFFPNYLDDILDHIDDDGHNDTLDEFEDLIEDEDISMVDFLNNNNYDKVYCERCSVFIPFSYKHLDDHVNGNRHCK